MLMSTCRIRYAFGVVSLNKEELAMILRVL